MTTLPSILTLKNTLRAVAFVSLGVLYAPLVVIVIFSFNDSTHSLVWHGFTWRWHHAVWQDAPALAALRNTAWLAFGSTALATVLGTALGYGLSRGPFQGKATIESALRVPVFLPDIALAAALLLVFSIVRERFGFLAPGLGAMIVAHVTFQIPYVAVVVRARLAGLDPLLEEAARDLGAGPWRSFWHVTLPLARPGIVAGALLAFTLSLDDFIVSFFTSGPGSTTLPIFIYSAVKRGVTPEVNALSTLIAVVSMATTAVLAAMQRTSARDAIPEPVLPRP